MTTESETPPLITPLVDRLTSAYAGQVRREEVTSLVADAVAAVQMFGTVDGELLDMAGRIAERDLRLRIGLEREAARLDPETRVR